MRDFKIKGWNFNEIGELGYCRSPEISGTLNSQKNTKILIYASAVVSADTVAARLT